MPRVNRPLLMLLGAIAITCTPGARSQGTTATVPAARPGCPPLPALDSVGLLADLFTIANDSMEGRFIGSAGSARTQKFLAARFDAVGLGVIAPGRLHAVPVSSTSTRLRSVKEGVNIVGVVRGTRFPGQFIVVTAHYDHLGIARAVNGDSIYNGADDNGSGTAALVTLARHFVRARPAHSIVFAAVDGEESGMWGSRFFVGRPTVPLDSILLNINLDMVSRNTKGELYAAGPGRYPQLTPLVDATAECSPITLLIGHDTPAAGPMNDWTNQSDQGAFAGKGIPFVYFGVEDHPDYHRPSDEADRIMPGFYVAATRTVADFIRRFDERPVSRR